MAHKAKKRRTVHRATSNARRHDRRSVVGIRRHNAHHRHHRRKRNPTFFGSHQTPMKMAELVAGGLIGVTVNRMVMPMLPATITSSNLFSTLAAFGLAIAEWWAASMISKDFGAAVGFGALMEAGSTALNTFIPQVGSVVGLSGYRRGVADFVPARFTIPENPVMLGNNPMSGVSGAYPVAYGRAA